MTLVHGREISAEQIELIVGRQYPVQRFASMCNAVVWALSQPAGMTQVALTERVFVADDGIDGELVVEVPPFSPPTESLFTPGLNVLQYKQRDVTARDRNRIVGDLRRNLEGAIREVMNRTGRPLESYVLFTNINLTIAETHDLEDAVRNGVDGTRGHVVGASELAAALNNLPHLRSAFFSTAKFATWERSWEAHNTVALTGTAPAHVGRTDMGLAAATAVDDKDIHVLLLAGPPDIGKTRLALEATRHKQLETVVAMEGRSLTVPDLVALIRPGHQLIVIIDDPDERAIESLISAGLSGELKLIMTVPSSDMANLINYGRDTRVKVFVLEPLTDEESRQLLHAVGNRLDYSTLSWVAEQAGGNPGVLIAAATVGDQLRTEGTTFFEQVGGALEKRARLVLGEEGVGHLGVLSVMTAVGFSGHASPELELVCGTLDSVKAHEVIAVARITARSGFLRITGSYLEVVPPVFANYLAEKTFAGRRPAIAALFLTLPELGRARFLKRLRQLRAEAVQAFWDELFQTGPMSTFEGALADASLLRLVAPAMPRRVADLLLVGLTSLSPEEIRSIAGPLRRDLVWTLGTC